VEASIVEDLLLIDVEENEGSGIEGRPAVQVEGEDDVEVAGGIVAEEEEEEEGVRRE